MRVEIVHRGRRRLVPIVLRPRSVGSLHVPGGEADIYIDDRHLGRGRMGDLTVAELTVELRLPGGHEPTDRFIEEMAEDLVPAGPDSDPRPGDER